jgi:hypothetical protein
MAIYTFGSGYLFGVRTDITTPTPRQFGTLQSVSVDFQSTSKELYGQQQFPVAVARGTAKIQCKAKLGQIQGSVFNDLYFGGTIATGENIVINNEQGTIGATPFTIVAANTIFALDLGVNYVATGLPFTRVASAPTTGQYINAGTGTYTFSAGDSAAVVALNYEYTNSAVGQMITLANPTLGVQPVFKAVLREQWQSPTGLKQASLTLNANIADKLSIGTKQEDFEMPELDFSSFADSSGNILSWSFSEAG